MKDPLVKGHPLHAILTDVPVGATACGAAFDLAGVVAGGRQWQFAATASYGVAFLGGCFAGLVGYWDYRAMPPEHPARQAGAIHGYLNAGALSALGLGVAFRARSVKADGSGAADTSLQTPGRVLPILALALLAPSGWLGGSMVYKLGWRVAPAERAEQLEQSLRQSGDDARIAAAHRSVREYEEAHALVP
jgi:uncharacterized membrane protein